MLNDAMASARRGSDGIRFGAESSLRRGSAQGMRRFSSSSQMGFLTGYRGDSGGATSLKEELAERFPELKDSATYRYARYVLREHMGGAMAIGDELQAAGCVAQPEGPDNQLLTGMPSQIFARIAAGQVVQNGMEADQVALGSFSSKFHICCNRVENDLHWDSTDPKWVKKSSMASRHRFLTTKDLHWQWFNALVFGLVPPEAGGFSLLEAIREIEDMKAAAIHYVKGMQGWSEQIGLFVNVFGHNNVNCLFVHILDMSRLGPSYELHDYKNLPLDCVLQVLREEAASGVTPGIINLIVDCRGGDGTNSLDSANSLKERKTLKSITCSGGATSLKAEITSTLPELKTSSQYRSARRLLIDKLGGVEALYKELVEAGFADLDGELTTGTKPFNLFARCGSGEMEQPDMAEEQEALGIYKDNWLVCKNRLENDEHWDSEEPEWVGKASMARRHRFLTTKDLHWQWFNALTFGIVPEDMGGVSVEDALERLEEMKAAALTYAANVGDWSDEVGLFFHVFGHNSVNSLHLHILDLKDVGPTFEKYQYKNCSIDTVIKVLREEESAISNERMKQQQGSNRRQTIVAPAVRRSSKESISSKEVAAALNGLQAEEVEAKEKWLEEILELNVAGVRFTVQRSTILLAPEGSRLRKLFDGDGPPDVLDVKGRIFLDLPPVNFQTIVDRLRILRLAPEACFDTSVRLSDELRQCIDILEVRELFPELEHHRSPLLSCFAWCQ